MYKKSLKRLNDDASISSDEAYKRLDTLRALLHEMENEVEAFGRARPDLDAPLDFFQEVEQFEIELINGALKRAHGNQKHASKLLGLNHTTLNSKIKRYGIDVPFTEPLGADSRGEHERGRCSN